MQITKSHFGGCLCEAIRFELASTPLHHIICHCQTCRKAIGATRVAWAVVHIAHFKFIDLLPVEYESSSGVFRTFCGKCGTSLTYRQAENAETIDITIASFDEPALFAPTQEIWLDDKVHWEIQNHTLAQVFKDCE